VLAAERDITVTDLGYRRATTLAIAYHPHLAELVAANGLFCALAGHARNHPDTELAVWLSQRDCQTKWGRVIQAHGFGRWRDHHREVAFFLHHHPQQQPIKTMISVLASYDSLVQAAPQLATNLLLVWLSRRDQEATLHRLVPPRPYVVATATPHYGADPAEAIWWPLSSAGPRRRLAELPHDRATSTRP
jgi:Replication-relaxation